MNIAPDERLQQHLRKHIATPRGRARLRERVGVEHKLPTSSVARGAAPGTAACARTSSTCGAPRRSRTWKPSSARWRDEISFNLFGALALVLPSMGEAGRRGAYVHSYTHRDGTYVSHYRSGSSGGTSSRSYSSCLRSHSATRSHDSYSTRSYSTRTSYSPGYVRSRTARRPRGRSSRRPRTPSPPAHASPPSTPMRPSPPPRRSRSNPRDRVNWPAL